MMAETKSCSYCQKEEKSWTSILAYRCENCRANVHYDCIKSKQPSSLLGDVLFKFKCQSCGEGRQEEFERHNLSWRNAVMLALYNLHKTGLGRMGYFHWKAHICAFISTHWPMLFGRERKKTNLWTGTVAGALSAGCPEVFESGMNEVEQGYWKLVTVEPPMTCYEKKVKRPYNKRQSELSPMMDPLNLTGRGRRSNKGNALCAAIELKEKRDGLTVNRKGVKQKAKSNKDKSKKVESKGNISQAESFAEGEDSLSSSNSFLPEAEIYIKAEGDDGQDYRGITFGLMSSSGEMSEHIVTGEQVKRPYNKCQAELSQGVDQKSKKKSGKQRAKSNKNKSKIAEIHEKVSYAESFAEEEDSVSSSGSVLSKSEIHIKTECDDEEEHADMSSVQINEGVETREQSSKLTFQSLGLSLGDDDNGNGSDLDIDIDIESVAINPDQILDFHSLSSEITNLIPTDNMNWEQASIPEMESLPGDVESDGLSERDIRESREESEVGDNKEVNDVCDDDDNVSRSTDECVSDQRNDESANQDRGGDGFSETEDVEARKKKQGRPRKRRRIDDPEPEDCPERLKHISVFEENELLKRLNVSSQNGSLTPELALLRRKLICNQTNREFGLPVFDLDAQVEKALKSHQLEEKPQEDDSFSLVVSRLPIRSAQNKETRDLDRFMMKENVLKKERKYTSFRQRLVGLEDSDLRPVVSPYTTRVLVPFIWRNTNMSRLPLKLRLLQEIQAYPHRKEPSWSPPQHPSIDYCYVRPEHIASVNALAREFFWPGIDMSECLQYPDFSCVVLYRKIVIAFAFMVPDRGYNEAYISFIFTHPEWRGVGIASFMLYHLIQTCMGKDVLLHVSASNPAMLLYQKFGFKAEELSLNFYYKYFPSHCTDSCHAYLMRLSR